MTLSGHKETVLGIAVSVDGRYVVSCSRDKSLKLWFTASGECLRTLVGHTAPVACTCISADGKLIVSGSLDKMLRIWDMNSGECLKVLEGHTDYVKSVSFSHMGRTITSGSEDNAVRVWDVSSAYCIKTLQGYTFPLGICAASLDGKLIVTGSHRNTVHIWGSNGLSDKESGTKITYCALNDSIIIATSATGPQLSHQVLDAASGNPLLHSSTRNLYQIGKYVVSWANGVVLCAAGIVLSSNWREHIRLGGQHVQDACFVGLTSDGYLRASECRLIQSNITDATVRDVIAFACASSRTDIACKILVTARCPLTILSAYQELYQMAEESDSKVLKEALKDYLLVRTPFGLEALLKGVMASRNVSGEKERTTLLQNCLSLLSDCRSPSVASVQKTKTLAKIGDCLLALSSYRPQDGASNVHVNLENVHADALTQLQAWMNANSCNQWIDATEKALEKLRSHSFLHDGQLTGLYLENAVGALLQEQMYWDSVPRNDDFPYLSICRVLKEYVAANHQFTS